MSLFTIDSSVDLIDDAAISPSNASTSLTPRSNADPKVNILANGSINHVPGRTNYTLGASGATSDTLSKINGALDQDEVVLWVEEDVVDPTEITITSEPLFDPEPAGDFNIVLAGDDFVMQAGDALVVRYHHALRRWLEIARLWVNQAYEDFEPDVDLIDADLLNGRPSSDFGEVAGPETSTTNAVARWRDTGGRTLKDSLIGLDNSGNLNALTVDQRVRNMGVAEVQSGEPAAVVGLFWFDTDDNALPSVGVRNPQTITANYTATLQDDVIEVDATSGPISVTLPAANALKGKSFTVCKIDSTGNVVSLVGTIDGDSSRTLVTQYASLTFYARTDGTEYKLV